MQLLFISAFTITFFSLCEGGFYSLSALDMKGGSVPLDQYKGMVSVYNRFSVYGV